MEEEPDQEEWIAATATCARGKGKGKKRKAKRKQSHYNTEASASSSTSIVPLDTSWQDSEPSVHGRAWMPYPSEAVHSNYFASLECISHRDCPTWVILDIGCAKAMGSRKACQRFAQAASERGMEVEFLPEHAHMGFANSERLGSLRR